MADREKDDERATGPAIHLGAEGFDWTLRLENCSGSSRIPRTATRSGPVAATFEVDGPNADAIIEAMVPDASDLEVVGVALDTLHGALDAWADLIQHQREAARTDMSEI